MGKSSIGICELCERENITVEKHHLIPRTRHKNKKNKKTFSRQEVKERLGYFCEPCHFQIHQIFSEKELETDYNDVTKLKSHSEVQKFIDWIKTKSNDFIPHK